MLRYQSVVGLIVLVLFLSGTNAAVGRVPEGLQDLLKANRFNLYASPTPANDMVLTDLKGRVLSLSSLRGKVVILNFWRIDCPPCASEKPILEKIYRRLAARGLEVVAVNLFDKPERLKSYVRDHGYSYRFGFDPSNRFSLQSQTLRPGLSTTFVVNEGSEAIYEVPGVPTTYVIDRKGAVIGNSVGMVDWERQPYWSLLDTLLQEPNLPVAEDRSTSPQVLAAAHVEPKFGDVAGRGAPLPPLGPTWKQAQYQAPVRQPQPPAESTSQPGLPFQGHSPEGPRTFSVPTAPQAPVPEAPTPEAASEDKSTERRKPARHSARPAEKPQHSQTGGTARRPTTQSRPAPRTRPETARAVPAPPPGNVSQPQAPPQGGFTPQPVPQTPNAGALGSDGLPPLPPALPYTPSARPGQRPAAAPRNYSPDQDGNVMARIPSGTGSYPGMGAGRPLPAGERVPANTIDRSILDTFETHELAKPQAPQAITLPGQQSQPTNQPAPASSILDQLGRDFQNLGSGIKKTFTGIWPGQR